jgi:hypothetical protein
VDTERLFLPFISLRFFCSLPARPSKAQCVKQWPTQLLCRANAAIIERKIWRPPKVDCTPSCPAWQDMDLHATWNQTASRSILAGEVAVQIFAEDDTLLLPDGSTVDLWGADPWAVLAAHGIEVSQSNRRVR